MGNSKGKNSYYSRNEYVIILKNKGVFNKNGELKISEEQKDSVILSAVEFYKKEKELLEEKKNIFPNKTIH
ncbi:hypothetical protein GCM10022393_41320 [Aquimarina addita]|uniref:Uncharacterized protein n=1 Tax=Aquimarina addita TaxID=870485 RepID=A0ABP6UWU9_9FLAO